MATYSRVPGDWNVDTFGHHYPVCLGVEPLGFTDGLQVGMRKRNEPYRPGIAKGSTLVGPWAPCEEEAGGSLAGSNPFQMP